MTLKAIAAIIPMPKEGGGTQEDGGILNQIFLYDEI